MTAPLRAMKAVYSFLYPEVEAIAAELGTTFDPRWLRVGAPAEPFAAWIAERVDAELTAPRLPDGSIDVDQLHLPLLERVVAHFEPLAPGLAGFAHRYPTAGSSEGLFHLLARLREQAITTIRVLAGEYEGFGIQAANLGLAVESLTLEEALASPAEPAACFLVSSPSARDGNRLPPDFLAHLGRAGQRLIIDLSYLGGTTDEGPVVDLRDPAIEAVVISLSKPYGLFRFRIGYTFARAVVPSLIGNMWFKDIERHLLGVAVLNRLPPGELPRRYRPVQAAITAELNAIYGLALTASDALLLASQPAAGTAAEAAARLAPFRRGEDYRLCLTPYFEVRRADSGS